MGESQPGSGRIAQAGSVLAEIVRETQAEAAARRRAVPLAEVGTNIMEFGLLSQLTGDRRYYDAAVRAYQATIDHLTGGTVGGIYGESFATLVQALDFTLTDLGSTNGTRLNGQTVQSRRLEDGDRITIGVTILDFRRE